MRSNDAYMEQLNRYYAIWQEYHYVYEERVGQRWMIPKQTVNMIFKDFEQKDLSNSFPCRRVINVFF